MTLTKEWLLTTIAELEEERDATPGAVNEDATNALAAMKLALASLEAEPDYMRYDCGCCGWETIEDWRENDVCPKCNHHPMGKTPLYTAPPAPVSEHDELLSAMEEVLHISDRDHDAWHKAKAGILSCRASMLRGAEPVTTANKLPDGLVACSEWMPDDDGSYWGWWSESKRQGPVWFIKSELQAQFQSNEITHWMPLPAAPN